MHEILRHLIFSSRISWFKILKIFWRSIKTTLYGSIASQESVERFVLKPVCRLVLSGTNIDTLMIYLKVFICEGLSKPSSITFEFTLKDSFSIVEELFPKDSKLFMGKFNAG